MLTYLSALIISLMIISFMNRKQKKKNRPVLYGLLAGLPFTLVSGLRYYVGTDYGIYRDVFNVVNLRAFGFITEIEKGYILLNKIVGRFTRNYQVMIFIMAFITITIYCISIYLLSINIKQSIFLWFLSLAYFESMNTVRQSAAVALFFLGIYFIWERKLLWYALTVLIAASFHKSAIILILIYWIINRRFALKKQVWVIVLALIGSRFFNAILIQLPLSERYLKYFIDVEKYTDFRLLDFMIAFLVWGLAWYARRFVSEGELKKYDTLLNLEFIAVLIAAVSGTIPMAYRLILYFIYTPVLLLPEAYGVIRNRKNRFIMKGAVIAMYVSQYLYYAFVIGIKDFTEYSSIF